MSLIRLRTGKNGAIYKDRNPHLLLSHSGPKFMFCERS